MFTGIIEAVGTLVEQQPRGIDRRLHLATGQLDRRDLKLGDSVAVNGVCLTVTTLTDLGFWVDVSAESLRHTTLGALASGGRVNLEKALTLATRLGGHLVSGHVDGVGTVVQLQPVGSSLQLRVALAPELLRFVAEKGSITIDGTSLTVTTVTATDFGLNLIPHTAQETTLSHLKVGDRVNVEVDLLCRYLDRLLQGSSAAATSTITPQFLAQHGFL